MTIRLGHHSDVGVHMCEAAVRYDELVDWWDRVASNFGSLAVKAISCPTRHVSAEGGPDELVSDHLPCAFDARVSQAVNRVENTASPCEWYEWSCRAV